MENTNVWQKTEREIRCGIRGKVKEIRECIKSMGFQGVIQKKTNISSTGQRNGQLGIKTKNAEEESRITGTCWKSCFQQDLQTICT